MYRYPSSTTISTTDEDFAPLLSSTPNNTNYSSIHRQSIEYASIVSAANNEGDLFEQDNESIRRRLARSDSTNSLHDQHKSVSGPSNAIHTIHHQGKTANNSISSHSYWQRLFDRYSTSVYLENKGSVARDHLANERTYLAWLRTSLSTISVGIGITQLFRLERSMTHRPPTKEHTSLLDGQMIGLLFIFISMIFLLFAFVRYFHAQVAMINGFFPASRSTAILASSLLLFTMILLLITVTKQ